jgi:MarR family transcriptional regulator for hemolysin
MRAFQDSHRSIGSLVTEISRLLSRNFNQRMRKHGLTQTQWHALVVLSKGEGMKQAELAELLQVQPISLARLVDRMETAGWIERRPDPNDRRAIQLYLTPRVEPMLDEMEIAGVATREEAFAGFSTTEREQLLLMLDRVNTNLREAESATAQLAPAVDGTQNHESEIRAQTRRKSR